MNDVTADYDWDWLTAQRVASGEVPYGIYTLYLEAIADLGQWYEVTLDSGIMAEVFIREMQSANRKYSNLYRLDYRRLGHKVRYVIASQKVSDGNTFKPIETR